MRPLAWHLAALTVALTQVVRGGSPGDLVITEIMANPSAVPDGDGEWFEVFNTTGASVDIQGWRLFDLGSNSHTIPQGEAIFVPAQSYVVLAINGDALVNGGIPNVFYDYPSGFNLGNGADEIILEDSLGIEIDRVEFDNTVGWVLPEGRSIGLQGDPAATDNSLAANWLPQQTPYGAGDLGTPGASNDMPTPASPGDIVITEFMADPVAAGDDLGEWFEVFNTTDEAIDLRGWRISDLGANSHTLSTLAPLIVAPQSHAVLAIDGDAAKNGGLPSVLYDYAGFNLSNGADEIILSSDTGMEIDRVVYDTNSGWVLPAGRALGFQGEPSAAANDDPSRWQPQRTPYGDGDRGTPGGANDEGMAATPGDLVITEIMNNPSGADNLREWFEVFNTRGFPIDLDGWTIRDDGGENHTIDTGGVPATVAPGAFGVVAQINVPEVNGGLPTGSVVWTFSGLTLNNTADEIILLDPLGIEVDRVAYDESDGWPDTDGASLRLDVISETVDNSDPARWSVETTETYGDGDFGSPGTGDGPPPRPEGAGLQLW
jgi:hypothetical protein